MEYGFGLPARVRRDCPDPIAPAADEPELVARCRARALGASLCGLGFGLVEVVDELGVDARIRAAARC